jgi:hypothetical protein
MLGSERTLNRAKRRLGVRARHVGQPGARGAWYWSLPPNAATTAPKAVTSPKVATFGEPTDKKDDPARTSPKLPCLEAWQPSTPSVADLIRAGIPETVAMRLTGHRTRSVFQRYAIVEEGMLREAGEHLAAVRFAGERGKVRAESSKVAELAP